MTTYSLPERLRKTFATLFVVKGPLPYALDVKCRIHGLLSKGHRAAYVHQALSQFCMVMLQNKDILCGVAERGFASPVYSEAGPFVTDDCLEFFDELYTEFEKNDEVMCDVICLHLRDLAKYLIFFNDVREIRIASVISLLEAAFDCLCDYQLGKDSDTKLCTCETYRKSGDCGCAPNVFDSDTEDDNKSFYAFARRYSRKNTAM